MNEIGVGFDYNLLNAETAQIVERRADEIKRLIRRTAQDMIEVGVRLLEVKALLPHGAFGPWLKAELDWSERTAQRLMSVALAFKSVTVSDLNIQPKALYLLAAPSTPEEARLEAIERAEGGEMISYAKAKAIVTAYQHNPRTHFTIRSQPTAHEPLPPQPETTDSTHSSFGTWIDRLYNDALTFQNLGRASELAVPLTVVQRRKLSAIIEFLESVAFFSEIATRDREDFVRVVVRSQKEDDP